jgi:anti-anti-sigma factor
LNNRETVSVLDLERTSPDFHGGTMRIRTDIHEYMALVSVWGELGDVDLVSLSNTLEVLRRRGYGNLVLNLAPVSAMSAAGLKAFVDHCGRLRSEDGDMTIVAVGPVQHLFHAMGVDQLFETCGTVIEAMTKLRSVVAAVGN